jgi:hypothetical protein
MRYLLLALLLVGCGSSASEPVNGLTPATLVATYQLRNYDGESLPSKTYGVAFGALTLRADSTYTITLTATPVGTTPAGWDWSFVTGTWSYMGHYFEEDVVFLRPSSNNARTWNGAIRNGGLSFFGNGYPDAFFVRSFREPSETLRVGTVAEHP